MRVREKNRRFVAEGPIIDTATFAPAGTGTHLTWQVDAPLNRVLEPLLRSVLRRYARRALAGLEQTLERRG